MKAWFFAAALALTGYGSGSNVMDQQEVLSKLLHNIGPRNLPLKGAYFTIRDEMAPPNSTLYRFNLTEGRLLDMHTRLKPTVSKDCYVQVKRPFQNLNVWCDFNLVGMEAKYKGALYYGARIVQNFTVSARIKPHSYNNNPALLTVLLREKFDCTLPSCELTVSGDSIFITGFELNTTTSPRFENFKSTTGPKFDKFENDRGLAERVWEDFNVRMYTDVLRNVVQAIKDIYKKELPKRVARLGPVEKKRFMQQSRKL